MPIRRDLPAEPGPYTCEPVIEARWVRLCAFAERWFEKMKEAAMSIEKPNEIMRVIVFENRRAVVMYNYCAMHSCGDIVVTSKRPRHVFQANIIGRETRRSQCAESSTQVGARCFVFSHV